MAELAAQIYEGQIWFSGGTEGAFDSVCDIHIGFIAP
jgi:hypothetical protein